MNHIGPEMDKAFDVLVNQGVLGALLVLFIVAIIAIQNRREREGEGRLKDAREMLTAVADVNKALTSLRDSVGGVAQSLASLTITVQTMHSDSAAYREATRERDRRMENVVDDCRKLVQSIDTTVSDAAELTIKNNRILKDLHERGTV